MYAYCVGDDSVAALLESTSVGVALGEAAASVAQHYDSPAAAATALQDAGRALAVSITSSRSQNSQHSRLLEQVQHTRAAQVCADRFRDVLLP